jgi:hypothetical protein
MASIPRKTRSTSSLKIGKTMAVGGARFLPGGFFVKGMRDLGRVTAEKGRQEPVNHEPESSRNLLKEEREQDELNPLQNSCLDHASGCHSHSPLLR